MEFRVETRSKHTKRGRSGFSGPDTYVVVLMVPDGQVAPYVLNEKVLVKRNIMMKYFGEGYSKHTSMRSMLGKCIDRAENFVDRMEEAMEILEGEK